VPGQSGKTVKNYFILYKVEVNRESRRAGQLGYPTMRRHSAIYMKARQPHNGPNLDFASQVENLHNDRPNFSPAS
jgi:hypothetical protein